MGSTRCTLTHLLRFFLRSPCLGDTSSDHTELAHGHEAALNRTLNVRKADSRGLAFREAKKGRSLWTELQRGSVHSCSADSVTRLWDSSAILWRFQAFHLTLRTSKANITRADSSATISVVHRRRSLARRGRKFLSRYI
ncbi:hypothetical protein F2P81_023291 [Scophthalmus maximus]|uniref:Secreted protein n=1 Tax=Scophthalmus maximus TaxID=52904 RepID=A0A6A4RW15_SCOMX|nr:hypothetical protein F2P81_023291 [Scophthalmus maximus]